jgi:membrane protease YdiL (CAAX protease family)
MREIALVVVGVAAAVAFAFRPELAGSTTLYLVMGGAYAALGALAVYRMWDRGTLVDLLKPRWGDLSVGVLIAAVLLMSSWAGRALLAPVGTERHAWLLRIYLQLGDAETIQNSIVIVVLLVLVPVLEEVVWRGMVLDVLRERFGARFAWPIAALLYALALSPTLVTLADPEAGYNPLLVIAGLGCGIFWSFTALVMKRLPPVMISHIAFSYFSVMQFRLPGM